MASRLLFKTPNKRAVLGNFPKIPGASLPAEAQPKPTLETQEDHPGFQPRTPWGVVFQAQNKPGCVIFQVERETETLWSFIKERKSRTMKCLAKFFQHLWKF